MASAKNNLSQVELAMCRFVEETTGHETIKFLGPGCLSRFADVSFLQSTSGTPNSDKFLVASMQVLTKSYLKAIEENEESKKSEPSLKIFAEFPRTKDRRSLERKPLSELYNSLEHDVIELEGIIYICLTRLWSVLLWKNSLLNRSLQAFPFNEETASSILASDLLQCTCLVFRGESTRAERNAVFETRVYDLLQFDSDDGKSPKYFLRSDTNKRIFKEDEFEEGEKPLGAVIVNKDNFHLAGFLNVLYGKESNLSKGFVPVLIRTKSEFETNMDHSASENSCTSTVTSGGGAPLPSENGLETNMGNSAASENSCRSIVTRGGGVPLPPENGETMQHSEVTRELPVVASAGVVRRLLQFWEDGTHVGRVSNPLLGPGLSSESQVGVDGSDKTTADNNGHLTKTASAPVEEIRGDEEKMLQEEGLETNMDNSAASENSCRSIVTRGEGVPLPPENGETMQHSKMKRELPVGVSTGVVRRLLEFWEDGTHAGETMQHRKMTRGLPVGTSPGGIYPVLEPGLSSDSQVGVDGGDRTTADNTDHLTETASAPLEEIVAQLNKTDLDKTVPQKLFKIVGDEEKVLEEEELEANGRPSPTETSYQSLHVPESLKGKLTVDLPAKRHKEEPPRREITPDGFQSVVANGKVIGDDFNNNQPKDTRSHTFPSLEPSTNEEHAKVKWCKSASPSSLMEEKTKINLGDPLSKTILDRLEILEGLGRSLDKEYKYGACKCWKHAAEYFGIEEQEYQSFKCKDIHSPTEVMFEYMQACSPETTIGHLKAGLRSIGRQDVIDVLIKYEQIMENEGSDMLTDETFVSSLFDINPDVIGEMAFLLDMQKVGLKNWQSLAAQLDIPRKIFKSFETCDTTNPTEQLFELLKVKRPGLSIAELVTHLRQIRRHDVINAIKKSAKVTQSSSIKDMMGDLYLMHEVCDMLNRKPRTNKVLGWRHLADSFGMDKDIVDDLAPPQEDLECPTEALVRHLGSSKPWLTIVDFIWALHKIARDDVFIVMDVYLPDRCIPNLLRSCDCDRCQGVTDKSQVDDAEEST